MTQEGRARKQGKVRAAQNGGETFPTEAKMQNPTPPPIRASRALPALPPSAHRRTLCTLLLCHTDCTLPPPHRQLSPTRLLGSLPACTLSAPAIGQPAHHEPPTLRLKICCALTHARALRWQAPPLRHGSESQVRHMCSSTTTSSRAGKSCS